METRSSMYKMKSIYGDVSYLSPKSTCNMYRMKNLMEDKYSENGATYDGIQPAMKIQITADELVERQSQLLAKLRKLSEEVAEIKEKVTASPSTVLTNKKTEEQSVGKADKHTVNEVLSKKVRDVAVKPVVTFPSDWDYTKDNVVINADPMFPPYSLLTLRYLYGDRLKLSISSHVHSTLNTFPDHLKAFLSLKRYYGVPHINVILIWREVGKDCQLILSPIKHKVILGEVNVLRFFDTLVMQETGCSEWSGQLDTEIRMISTLDWAHQFRHFEGKRSHLLSLLEKRLKQRRWLVIDEDVTIGDASVWSILATIYLPDLSPSIISWLQKCGRTFSE